MKKIGLLAIASAMAAGYEPMYEGKIESATPNWQRRKQPRGYKVIPREGAKPGRNMICPYCESGLKYKKCCGR